MPLLRPVTAFLLVWLTINALQLFDEVYATTKGGPLHATTVVVYYLYEQAFVFFHAGYAAAIAAVLFVVIAVITIVQLRLTRDPSAAVGRHDLVGRIERSTGGSPVAAGICVLIPVASADGGAAALDAGDEPVDAGRDPAVPARAAVLAATGATSRRPGPSRRSAAGCSTAPSSRSPA